MSQTQTLEIVNIPVGKIKPSPYQPRLVFDLEELRGSIIQYGIRDPLKVRKVGDHYEIIDGERRWRIAEQEGMKTVACLVLEYTDEEADALSWRFNTERKEYSLEERAKHFRKHQEAGLSGAGIGNIHGYSRQQVDLLLSIFRLPGKYQNYLWTDEFAYGKYEYLYNKGLMNRDVRYLTELTNLIDEATERRLTQREFENVVDDYVSELEKRQVEEARKVATKIEASKEREKKTREALRKPEVTPPETPEDFERAAEALRREAERRKTPKQKAEEKRRKLIAQAQTSLNSTIRKIESAEKIIDASKFRKDLDKIKKILEQNPAETKTQLADLGKKITEAKKQRQKEVEEEKRRKQEEEMRRKVEKETKQKLLEKPEFVKELPIKDIRRILKERAKAKQKAYGGVALTKFPEVREADLVHKVVIGDARQVLKLMPDSSVDLVVTSPPYFDLKEYPDNPRRVNTQSLDRYLEDLEAIFDECFRVLRDGTFLCVVVGQFTSEETSYFIPSHMAQLLESIGFRYRREHVWVKPLGIQGLWNRGTTSFLKEPYPRNTMINIHHEHVLIFQKGDKPSVFHGRNPLTEDEIKQWCWSVWELPVSEVKEHPAPFPEAIAERLIKMYSYEGEIVLDPFLGSGTTMKMAKTLRRRSIGIDVASEYLPLIQKMVGGAEIMRHDKGKRLDFTYLTETSPAS